MCLFGSRARKLSQGSATAGDKLVIRTDWTDRQVFRSSILGARKHLICKVEVLREPALPHEEQIGSLRTTSSKEQYGSLSIAR